MKITTITDRCLLEKYFRSDISLHAYSLGDLDNFYWPNTTYFGIQSPGDVDQVSLLYRGEGLPILLALGTAGKLDETYLKKLIPMLPDQFYAHFSPGVEKFFKEQYNIQDMGDHYKMKLDDLSTIRKVDAGYTVQLTEKNLTEIFLLYERSYPDNAFDPRMLLTGQYYGYLKDGRLVSISGVHVFSPEYRTACLGNITTHPDFRYRGFGRAVTTRLCLALSEMVDFIGLNVKANNLAALSLYKSLGFVITAQYGEFCLKKRA